VKGPNLQAIHLSASKHLKCATKPRMSASKPTSVQANHSQLQQMANKQKSRLHRRLSLHFPMQKRTFPNNRFTIIPDEKLLPLIMRGVSKMADVRVLR
jgi:hypothetical protein